MFRRLLTAATVLLVLGSSLAPAAAFALGDRGSHTDCCCPDPALCPIVRGEHLCSWMKRGEKPPAEPAHDGPRIASCAEAEMAFERADAVVWLPSPRATASPVARIALNVLPPADARSRGPDAPELPPPRS